MYAGEADPYRHPRVEEDEDVEDGARTEDVEDVVDVRGDGADEN